MDTIKLTKSLWGWLFLSIILRIFFAATTFHPDISALNLAGKIIADGNILTFYDYLLKLPVTDPLRQSFALNVFTYPPPIYLLQGLFHILWVQILGFSALDQFIVATQSTFGNSLFNISLLLLKIPYLLFDIPIAFFLTRLVSNNAQKKAVFLLWLFNPVNFFATYMMGQHDVIAVFFIVLSLVYATKNALSRSALSLGLGIAVKVFPIFLLIPLILSVKGWALRIKLLIVGLIPYAVVVAPYIMSKGFRATALFANQSEKSLYAQIPISGGENIILFPALLLLAYLVFLYKRSDKQQLIGQFFVVLLLFFIFTHSHPQWFLWLTPFLIIDLVQSHFNHWILVVGSLISFLVLLSLFDPSLSVGLFSPLWPNLAQLPRVWELIHLRVDTTFLRSVFQTLFVGIAGFYIYSLATKVHNDQ